MRKFKYGFEYGYKCAIENAKNPEMIYLEKLHKIIGFEDEEIYVYPYTCNFTIVKAGCALAALMNVKFSTAEGDLTYPVILCDENFVSLPEEVQTFLIFHEVGHFKNGDLEKEHKHQTFTRKFRLDPMEAGADLFAAKLVSKEVAIKALKILKSKMPLVSAIEIGRRIRALEKEVLV